MSATHAVVVANVRLVEPIDGLAGPLGELADVAFRDGRVAAVVPAGARLDEALITGAERVDGDGLWLLPGWLDIQVNDIEWLAGGLRSPDEHRERILDVLDYQLARGVTGCVLATLAAPEEEIVGYLRGMRLVLDDATGLAATSTAFLGALVEGTFMNPEFHGAHNPAHVVPPEIPLLDRFLDTGAVRLVNVAPEMSEDAIDVIRHATHRGAIVGVGHAKPHAERVREAVAAGLRYVIHLGNGPTGSSLKRFSDGGLLEESLSNDAITVTLIADGYHLNPRLVRDYIERKGLDNTIAVSDAGFARGNPEGEFEVFGIRGRVSDDGRYLQVVPPAGAPRPNPLSSDSAPLFGSASDMRGIFETTLNLLSTETRGVYFRRHAPLALPEALAATTRLCSTTPARLLGITDRGTLRETSRADAILARIEGAPGGLRVGIERVWLAGKAR